MSFWENQFPYLLGHFRVISLARKFAILPMAIGEPSGHSQIRSEYLYLFLNFLFTFENSSLTELHPEEFAP